MMIVPIVDEFSDYRAHVSHDLCKQRIQLHLTDLAAASGVMQDAYAWPLLRDEVRRLLALGPTLFGLVTPVLAETGERAGAYLSAIEEAVPAILGGQENGLVRLRTATEGIGMLLSQMGEEMRERRPGFSERAVLDHLGGKGSLSWLADFCGLVRDSIEPHVRTLLTGRAKGGASYRGFWEAYPEAQQLLRCVVVGAAAEDQNARRWQVVTGARAVLTDLVQVVVAANPLVPADARTRAVETALEGTGCDSGEDLLRRMRELGK